MDSDQTTTKVRSFSLEGRLTCEVRFCLPSVSLKENCRCTIWVFLLFPSLGKANCVSLMDCITARVLSWTQHFLSFAGRLQLIRSILHAIQAYWASIFTIPVAVLDCIEQVLRQFLWKGPSLGRGGVKVS